MFFSVRAFEEKNSFFFCKRRGSSACICLHLNATGEDMRFPAVALDGSFSFFFLHRLWFPFSLHWGGSCEEGAVLYSTLSKFCFFFLPRALFILGGSTDSSRLVDK